LADHAPVTAISFYDRANYRRLKPQWPETASGVNRVSIVMPPGYAGTLEPLFRPLMRTLVAREQLRLRRMAGSDPVVVAPYPYLAPWVRGVPGGHLVYYNLDEYPMYEPARKQRILRQEGELVAHAGLTVCLSAQQVKTLRARNPMHADRIRHFPLGVVEDFLNPEPQRVPLRDTVGYVGNLSDRVDWEFISSVAWLMPDAKFHIVGRLDPEAHDSGWRAARKRTLAMPNVVYEGEVPQAEVREHYWRYAVNWMPYDTRHGFNIASCPTKIMDALASGRPFVATDIPEIRLYPDRIACVTTPDDAAAVLRRLLCGETPHDATSQVAFAAQQTWAHRSVEFRRLLDDCVKGPSRKTAKLPPIIRAAVWWNKHGPKGRGVLPRIIGRRWSGQELYISTKHNGLLLVDPKNLDVYASIINSGGTWEPHVMHTCARILRPGDVYFDIGSNTGLFSIDAAVSIPDLKIYAFEPQPTLAECIRRSIRANGLSNVHCLEMLLGQEDGEEKFYLTSHSIHASLSPREDQFQELLRPMRTLDGLVASGQVEAPDVIKIDVEGAELMVFEGAARTLRDRTPSVIFEADDNMARMNVKTQDLFDSLNRAGPYMFYLIGPDGTLTETSCRHELCNYLALSPRHRGRLERQRKEAANCEEVPMDKEGAQ
jgi:FkbM family methyltransferase